MPEPPIGRSSSPKRLRLLHIVPLCAAWVDYCSLWYNANSHKTSSSSSTSISTSSLCCCVKLFLLVVKWKLSYDFKSKYPLCISQTVVQHSTSEGKPISLSSIKGISCIQTESDCYHGFIDLTLVLGSRKETLNCSPSL